MAQINFYHTDCIDFMKSKPDNHYSLSIVDPPYGINITSECMGGRQTVKPNKSKVWDLGIPNEKYFEELLRVSKNQIIWGGNYFPILGMYNPKIKRISEFKDINGIVWDKGETMYGRDFSEAEIAYSSIGNGWFKKSPNQLDRIHPTQKPIALYKWLLKNYATTGDKILDTHGGSMSSAIACDMMGFDLDICEIDKEYFDAGKKRFDIHKLQQVIKF